MSVEVGIISADRTDLPTFTISPHAIELRDEALAGSALIGKVENAEQNEAAVAALKQLKSIALSFEKARKTLKEPLLEAGRRLDRTVAMELDEIEKESGRVSNLLNQFALTERRRIAEEQEAQRRELERIERDRLAELARIDREKREAERKAKEAEEAARRAEADAKTQADKEAAAEKQKAAADAARAAADAAEKAAAESKRVEEHSQALAAAEAKPVVATRAEGQVTKTDWEITVINPWELAKFHPDCVKIEPLLQPIKQALNAGISVKGVRAERVVKSGVRTTGKAVIEV